MAEKDIKDVLDKHKKDRDMKNAQQLDGETTEDRDRRAMEQAKEPYVPTGSTREGIQGLKQPPEGNATVEVGKAEVKSKEEVTQGREIKDVSVEGDKEEQKKTLLSETTKILEEYGGRETDIPLESPYWAMMNKYRSLLK